MKIILLIVLIGVTTYTKREIAARNETIDELMKNYKSSLEENQELLEEQYDYAALTRKQTDTIDKLKLDIEDKVKELNNLKWQLGTDKIVTHKIDRFKRLRL